MPITDELKKTLTDPTPLYALAGAGDLAYEKLREVPGKVEALAADRKGAQEMAGARLQEAQAKLAEAQAKVAETVTTLPTDFKALQERAQDFAIQQVGRAVELAVKAKETYDELAERGKVVVERTRPGSQAEPTEPTEPAVIDAEVIEDDAAAAAAAAAEPAPKKTPRTRKDAPRGE
ncbi:hypothetical protein ACFXDE_40980 [Kitasatospora sp. NPDC059408]|uniref:hypothetical protein n=1 Tax=Kitasatospora sp. NPDC059408 TaxID=3346823 RepID=UPI0036BBD668